jgi:transcription antitermination factor NusG
MGDLCLNPTTEISGIPLTEPPGRAWYSVQTGYRSEARVARDLAAKGFETYLPVLREVHQWTDRRKVVEVPAFGGYLFLRYQPSLTNRIKILETSGVLRMLGGNHTPSLIPDFEIEAVRRTLSSGLECSRCETLVPGSLVRVKRGPLAGVRGTLVRMKNSVRIIVAISAFAQAISAELGLNDVEEFHDIPDRTVSLKEASARQFVY